MFSIRNLTSVAAIATVLAGAASPGGAAPGLTDVEWRGHGNTADEMRFSPLTQINDETVDKLGLAWSLDLPDENALEGTPLEVGGTLYFSGSFATVYAVDAVSGHLLWKYDPHASEQIPRAIRRMYGNNRGVAYWNGHVLIATPDGRMISLDAKTGKPVWSSAFLIPGTNAISSGAPRVFKDKIIIGNAGAEVSARGYITAFDAKTGKLLWRFFIVPGDPAKGFEDKAMAEAAKTWSGEWWKLGGGGTPWNGITYDEELDQLYIGTGNGGPWNPAIRSKGRGDNLYLCSVVALDANTGKYKWHYQYNQLESWDWKATADMILTDLPVDGSRHKVLMQAPSNGFFYVIDRTNGRLLSAEKIGKENWADRIDLATGRPIERPGIRYDNAPVTLYPSAAGAHNWQASSYNPNTGLIYIPYMQFGMIIGKSAIATADVTDDPHEIMLRVGADITPYSDKNDPMDGRGSLLGWDPVAQKLRWRVDYPSAWNAGTMTTAGNLVFQGTNTGQFYAYNATSGARLWTFDAKLGILAPPITYSVKGRQFVSLLVGYGGGAGEGGWPGLMQGWKYGAQPRRLLTFAIGGKAELPATAPADFSVHALDDPALTLTPAAVALGARTYNRICTSCHGAGVISTGGAPDLRESAVAFDRASFTALLRQGSLVPRGMPKFDDFSPAQIDGLYQYIRQAAREAKGGNPS